MHPRLVNQTLLIASGNPGKVAEITALLAPYPIHIASAATFHIPEPEETGHNFIENAVLKARYYSAKTSLPALADDSGLCVEALQGQPGIYSARWAGADKNFFHAMQRIEQSLSPTDSRRAYFVCALCIGWPDGEYVTVEGTVHGTLTFPPRGTQGFGYDPIFIPDGYTQTFGEMTPHQKEQLSHRQDAFRQLVAQVF